VSAVSFPSEVWAEPQPKSNLVHYSFKIYDPLATILVIMLRINWSNWQILCSLYACLCFVWKIGGLGPLSPLFGYATDSTSPLNFHEYPLEPYAA